MKLQVSNTNAPAWRDITVKSELPSKLKPLEELAKNLWWVWNSEAKALFRDLNPELWRSTGENPVMVLQQLSSERLDEVIADKDMMGRLKHVYGMFKDYMAKPMRSDIPSVSYFSMEYGLCNALKISPDYLLRDSLTDNDISKIRELTELWESTPPSQQEIATAMIQAVLERKKE